MSEDLTQKKKKNFIDEVTMNDSPHKQIVHLRNLQRRLEEEQEQKRKEEEERKATKELRTLLASLLEDLEQ